MKPKKIPEKVRGYGMIGVTDQSQYAFRSRREFGPWGIGHDPRDKKDGRTVRPLTMKDMKKP